jgi:hypothetical protein
MIEYFLFCADDQLIDLSTLVATVNGAGWSLHVLRNWFGSDALQLVADGVLQEGDAMCGWPQNADLASKFDAGLRAHDRKQLKDWIYNSQIGFAIWAIDSPFQFATHAEFESLDDAREQMGDRYADHLNRTKCRYVVTNCPDMEFTAIIMGTIAFLRDGMVEDPQLGVCIAAPSSTSELPTYLQRWPVE